MVFMSCIQLNVAILPQGIKEISDGLFMRCVELKKGKHPIKNSHYWYAKTFSMCKGMKKTHPPEVLNPIKINAFLSSGIVILNIAQGVNEIEKSEFLF